ncbi:MAG TPA: hypothetical protein VN878_09515 [Usitatibacter sp.]|nr:hypothetical protein [Usitatibacter sp.]
MSLRSLHKWLCCAAGALCSLGAGAAGATGFLENPQPNAAVSGISVVSGWHCSASRVELVFDQGAPVAAAYGTDRLDTLPTCGRRNTGFALLTNWAVLGAGPHSVQALADGVEFARASFNVVTLGSEFLTGQLATTTLNDFPAPGQGVVLEWRESAQSFVVQRVLSTAPSLAGRWNGANLEQRSNCTQAQNNGNHGTYAQYQISLGANSILISESGVTGIHCDYSGNYRQTGVRREASGSYSCSDGKSGTWQATSFLVSDYEMSIRLAVRLTGTETCSIDAILGGSRWPS